MASSLVTSRTVEMERAKTSGTLTLVRLWAVKANQIRIQMHQSKKKTAKENLLSFKNSVKTMIYLNRTMCLNWPLPNIIVNVPINCYSNPSIHKRMLSCRLTLDLSSSEKSRKRRSRKRPQNSSSTRLIRMILVRPISTTIIQPLYPKSQLVEASRTLSK